MNGIKYLDSKVPTTRRVEKTGLFVLEPGHMTHRYSEQSDSIIITNIISCAYAFTAMYYGIYLYQNLENNFIETIPSGKVGELYRES